MEQKGPFSATVVIVGSGLSGLATAACLADRHIDAVILERDDTFAPLWRYRTYDRLHLHLPKKYCELPLLPHPPSAPNFLPVADFIRYLNAYSAAFGLERLLRLRRRVDSAEFDTAAGRWRIAAVNLDSGEAEEYEALFLVVATGENDEPVVPTDIPGLDRFEGKAIHSCRFRSGKEYEGLDVLVVGSGNSGMEIACDLSHSGARASIVVRSPLHIVTKEIYSFALVLLRVLPMSLVDSVILFLCYLWFGNTSKYGLHRPSKGPLYLKENTPIYPVVDVGTYAKIKSGDIKIIPSVLAIEGKNVVFKNGKQQRFDVIILATGYKSNVKRWLKGDDHLIGEDGMAKQMYPNHWKGRNGLYCSGLIRRGIYGSTTDAINIADDISLEVQSRIKDKVA
ncbi:hypothetical protein HPP92_000381 [Vanilla planifolia]|uniref:Flavin-containing monooxygenase n=1 Tax=Vanilla planifolia TaxID=51239 RepID=A0A835RWA9_VANPL|nr:hypothetical protein HPP92_000381 [Vanilla planifolia]